MADIVGGFLSLAHFIGNMPIATSGARGTANWKCASLRMRMARSNFSRWLTSRNATLTGLCTTTRACSDFGIWPLAQEAVLSLW